MFVPRGTLLIGFKDGALEATFEGESSFKSCIPIGKYTGFVRTKEDSIYDLAKSIVENHIVFYDQPIPATPSINHTALSPEDWTYFCNAVNYYAKDQLTAS